MQSNDTVLRGLAVWASIPMADESIISLLKQLSRDKSRFSLYSDWQISEYEIGQIARDAVRVAGRQSF
jgi:hypothetical protein